MKIFILFFFIIELTFALQVEIVADRFDSDRETRISVFTGNVKITKEEDKLFSELLTVYTDNKNHPIKYIATTNVTFSITSEDKKSVYSGRSQKLIFFPEQNVYEFYTDVLITQKGSKRTIQGDKVLLDSKTGSAKVIGKKKEPIRITFELGEPAPVYEMNSTKKQVLP